MSRPGPVAGEPMSGGFEVVCKCGAKAMAQWHVRWKAVDGEWELDHGVTPPEGWEFDGKEWRCGVCSKRRRTGK